MLLEQKERILLADGTNPDVVIKCYDKDIFTHRIILAAVSRWFQALLQVTDTDEDLITILLKDFSSIEILPIIEFVYGRCETLSNCSAVIQDLYLDIFNPECCTASTHSTTNNNVNSTSELKDEPKLNLVDIIDDEKLDLFDDCDTNTLSDLNHDHDSFIMDFFPDEVKVEPDLGIVNNIKSEKSTTRKRKSAKRNSKIERLKDENRDLDAEFEKEGFNFEDEHCHICDTKFRDQKSYRRHVYNVHASRKTFQCEHCDYVATKDPGKLRIHMAMNHGGHMIKCNMCDYETPILKYLDKHKKKMHQGLSYKCDECDHTTNHKQLLQQHIKVKHQGFKLSCDQCLYTTGDQGALKKHRLNKHEGVVYPCDECDYVANAANNLNRHKRVKHQEAEFLCDRCDYKTGDKGCLKEHQQIKHEGLLFRCDECDYSTKARSSLRVHKETIHLGITYPCDDCEYTAKTRKDLRYHRARKHDEAKYKCDLCDYGVAAISLLNQHIMFKHEGKKIYCDVCPYFATSHQAVNKHKIKKHQIIN